MPKLKFIPISLLLLFSTVPVNGQVGTVIPTVEWQVDGKEIDKGWNYLKWPSLDPAKPDCELPYTAKVFYELWRIKGYQEITVANSDGADGVAGTWEDLDLGFWVDGTEWRDNIEPDDRMTYGYAIRVWDDSIWAYGDLGDTVYSPFIYEKSRRDMLGKQIGFGQKWFHKFKLQADCYLTIKFYRAATFPNVPCYVPGSIPPEIDKDYYDDLGFRLRLSTTNIQNMDKVPQEIQDAAAKPDELGKRQGEHAFLTKTLLQNVARYLSPGPEGPAFCEEEWDCRNDDAKMVKNDCYWIMIEAFHAGAVGETYSFDPTVSTIFPYTEQPRLDAWYFTLPVDLLRIINLDATGIDATHGESTISYDLTGDAKVKTKICLPGTDFKVDLSSSIQTSSGEWILNPSYGEALPVDSDGEFLIDTETRKCWSYLDKTTYHITSSGEKEYGRLVWEYVHYMKWGEGKSNIWNGTDSEGNPYAQISKDGVLGIHYDWDEEKGKYVKPNGKEAERPNGKGTYQVVISAVLVDEQHNIILDEEGRPICATGEEGNDQPILTRVTYDKTPPPAAVDATFPTIKFISPKQGASVESIKEVIVEFSDAGDNLNPDACEVYLTVGAAGEIKGSKEVTGTGSLLRVTFTPSEIPTPTEPTICTIKAVGIDAVGNSTEDTATFTLEVTEKGKEESLEASLKILPKGKDKPGPVTEGEVRFCYAIPTGKTAEVTISVYDILGNLVHQKKDEVVTEGEQEHRWECAESDDGVPLGSGVYIYKFQAKIDDKTYRPEVKEFMIIQ